MTISPRPGLHEEIQGAVEMELEQPVFLRLSQVRVEEHRAKVDGDSFGPPLERPPA